MTNRFMLFTAAVSALAVVGCGVPESSSEPGAADDARTRPPAAIVAEEMQLNARRGRILFIAKGCVICHSVNEVGGKAAPSISAPAADHRVNPLDFSARMWKGAAAMAALQEVELGYQIDLDAQDIADLAAFAGSAEEQELLTASSVPASLRDWFINEPILNDEDWQEYRERGERIPDAEEFDE